MKLAVLLSERVALKVGVGGGVTVSVTVELKEALLELSFDAVGVD